jgi:hypothetical protein
VSEESSRRWHPSAESPSIGRTERVAPTWWVDTRAVDIHGLPLGVIAAVYRDTHTGEPAWLGLIVGRRDDLEVVIAPIEGAAFDGTVVTIGFDRARVVATSRAVVASLAAAIGDVPPPRSASRSWRCGRRRRR